MTDDQKAAAYYKAGMLQEAPPFVPARGRVKNEQLGDFPFCGAGVPAGEHDCHCNKWGAVSVKARDGKLLGLRPNEFEPIAWRENITTEITGRRLRRSTSWAAAPGKELT
jgi:hypothetical protein